MTRSSRNSLSRSKKVKEKKVKDKVTFKDLMISVRMKKRILDKRRKKMRTNSDKRRKKMRMQ